MKKKLLIIVPIVMIFVLVFTLMIIGSVGTFSWFSDQEVSNGNTLTAGTLDLKVDNLDGTIIHIDRTNIKPYAPWSHSYGGQWILKNAGNLPGKFTVQIINIKNYENGINDPEAKAGDITGGTGSDQGELGSQMYGKWMENHYGIYSPAKGWAGSALFNPINTANGITIDGIVLQPGDLFSAYLDLEFDTQSGTINNLTQSDSLEFDIVFRLEQIQ
jgi:predicted ribosomally synthesized peptide with SipW-like signal peptide